MQTKNNTKTLAKKQNFSIAPLKELVVYGKRFLTPFLIAVVLTIFSVVCTIIGPNKLGDFVNEISNGMLSGSMNFDVILKLGLLLAFIYVLAYVFELGEGLITATITQKMNRNLRRDISNKINKLPQGYIDKVGTGDLTSRITNDVDLIGQALSNNFVGLVYSVVMFIGCVIMMLVTNWILAIASITASFVGFGLMGFIVKKSQKHFVIQQQKLGKINSRIEEDYNSHILVSTNNGYTDSAASFDKENSGLYTSAWKSQFLSGLMMPLMGFVGNLGFVVVCVVGAILFANGQIEIGVIVSFMVYARLFSQPLSQLAQGLTGLQQASAASGRVFELLHQQEMPNEDQKTLVLLPEQIKGEIEFVDVCFGYQKDKQVINNFNLKVMPGQKVAIVGPTGAGKTTLVNLLMRFYEIDSGDIKIDGVSTKDLTREQVHSYFGMVLQDTWLFEGTIKQNLVYNKQNITDNQIMDACKMANIDHFIRTLPQGYDTVLEEQTAISAGQKQLLTIARAMIANNPMLILDEATSSVDTRTETQIQQAMDNLTKGRTSFIIAHRLSTIKNADIILVMQHGTIVEQGNHKTLMQQNGVYANLYNSQFSKNGCLVEEK